MFGNVHSIETFGTLDGPGIRYVVFLQGCMLKCKYCHNRDTWEMNCGTSQTAEDIVADALKYKTFFDASGGGITVSGGEATLQPDFICEIFSLAKQNGLHTCIDTCGFTDINNIKKLMDFVDLVILDIKSTNPDISKWLTGQTSERAMEIARFLDKNNKPMWIRHVLVPHITDHEDDLRKLARFVNSLKHVEKFEFLPYHTLGEHKWEKMGFSYPLKGLRPATDEDVQRANKIFQNQNSCYNE